MLDTDYLIIGAGAVGMNIADVLLDETDADLLIVDRHAAPGGHWNDAYPFVRLHQPAVHYGVASRALGSDRIDASGPNKGMHELPSGADVCAHFDAVMRERLLPSGRVQYLPMHEVADDDSAVTGLLSGVSTAVHVRRKVVDTTFLNSSTPSRHKPKFEIADGVRMVTPNALPDQTEPPGAFTIIGGGKTAMDTCIWLIGNGVSPDMIRWIRPRESWLINRATTQPGDDFFAAKLAGYAAMMEAAAYGDTVDDVFARLEATGAMLRIDRDVWPTSFRNGTIAAGEIDVLQKVKTVIRKGYVKRITPDTIIMDDGDVPAAADHLYIDCTAKAFQAWPSQRIFTPGRITPQLVVNGSVCLSAGIIAWVEAHYADDAEKNDILAPVPLMNTHADWLPMIYWHLRNSARWASEPDLVRWVKANRMSGHGGPKGSDDGPDPVIADIMTRLKTATPKAGANLARLVDLSGHPNA